MPSPPRSPSPKKRQRRQPDADDYNGGSAPEYTRSAPSSDRKSPEETAATPRPCEGALSQFTPLLAASPSFLQQTQMVTGWLSQVKTLFERFVPVADADPLGHAFFDQV
ncbi:hypothetical protein PG989_001963 [Apiospora arundinis]